MWKFKTPSRAIRLSRTLATSAGSEASKYRVGSTIHGFTIEQVKHIPEFSLTAVHLKHPQTGSEHLHLDPQNDTNNVFSIGFKTNPPDATGVPHILEHTTLCGSHKYPVRDPFFKMTNRSLSNFMNAMTGHDYTYYPFATTNAKDFENLMDVYLSSVFEPLLSYNDFIQEGWRLENEDPSNPDSSLTFKGVVYNEMKGQNSNSSYYFYIKFLESIYPSLNNSGGNPPNIVDLKWTDLRRFHAQNYQPSNAKIFTYGSLPLSSHLQRLDEYFGKFENQPKHKGEIKYPIFESKDYSSSATLPGPIDTMSSKPVDHQYKTSITWYLGNPLDENNDYDVFKWKILSSLLCDGHNSPFYQELIETELGEDFSPNTGFDTTTALASFTLGLNNCSLETVNSLETKVTDIFTKHVLPEFSNPQSSYHERIEAILHQIELNLKKHKPEFGLGLLNSILPNWINNVDPIKLLEVEGILTRFKEDYKKNGLQVFKSLLDESVLNSNTEKYVFTMEPKVDFSQKLIEEEKDKLEQKIKKLTAEDLNKIHQDTESLIKQQSEEQDGDVLPSLTIEDIAVKGDFYPLNYSRIGDKTLQTRIVDTNGLSYASAVKDVSFMSPRYYKYLPLFSSCLSNLAGTETTPITELETKIARVTGGINFNFRTVSDPYDITKAKLRFTMNGMALKQNSPQVYELWHEILTHTRLDDDPAVVDKLYQLIKNMGQNQLNSIADRGHSYSGAVSTASLTPVKYVNDMMGGLSQVQFIMEMNAKLEKQGKEYLTGEILPVLREIKSLVLGNQPFKYRLVGDQQLVNENIKFLESFDKKLPTEVAPASALSHKSDKLDMFDNLEQFTNAFNKNQLGINVGQKTLVDLPFQVGYASLARLGTNYVDKDGASLQVLAQLMSFKHLHSVIRESNGAYGGGLTYDGLGGTLNFYSYRDPNATKSIQAFENSFDYGLVNRWEDKDLQQAKLRIFQSIDAPMNISSQGSSEFYEGITDEMRQQRRENFLSVNQADLDHVIRKYLTNEAPSSVTVIGDNQLLKVDDSWTVKEMNVYK